MAPILDAQGRYTDKDQTIIIDAKSNHDWIVPRRVMCAFFWIGIILLFTGIILLVTSKHKGEVYRSWGAILLGLGFCLLLICLILCLHAYCVITITEEEPLAKRNVPPPPPSVVMNGRKPRNKGEGRVADGGNEEPSRPTTPKNAKPVQLLIVEKDDVDALESGKPLYFKEDKAGGLIPAPTPEKAKPGAQTATVSHPILGDVHVSVRPANPSFGAPSILQYDVESTEHQIRTAQGPIPADIPLHLLENLDERSIEGDALKSSPNNPPREHVIIPTKYATAFSPVSKSGTSSRSNPDGANTYIGYQEGLDINAFPLGQILTTKPPPIPGRHNSQITAHVIPIPYSHFRNYPVGILPPPPNASGLSKMLTQSMALREDAVRMQMVPNGQPITINMPENYIQRVPPEHDHDGRRFSQPVVVYLNPNQNMGLSQLSVYDNVQYVWAEPPAATGAAATGAAATGATNLQVPK